MVLLFFVLVLEGLVDNLQPHGTGDVLATAKLALKEYVSLHTGMKARTAEFSRPLFFLNVLTHATCSRQCSSYVSVADAARQASKLSLRHANLQKLVCSFNLPCFRNVTVAMSAS